MTRLSFVLGWVVALAMLAVGTDLAVASGPSTPTPKPAAAHAASAPKCTLLHVKSPNTLAGLRVQTANPCSTFLTARGSRALNGIALLTLRQSDNLLIATLEVGRFEPAAPVSDPSFRSQVIVGIGDVTPRQLQVGGQTVYTSASPGLQLLTWIRGRYLYVLAIRGTFGFPKSLLRDSLQVQG